MLSCRPLHFYIKTDAGTFLVNKNFTQSKEQNKQRQRQTMFTLKSISKRNKSFVYNIEVKVSDETYYVEMRKKKLNSNSIYLWCTSGKCNAKLSIVVKPGIPIEKLSRTTYKFGANITDDMMLDTKSYGEVYHKHRNCRDIRNDGTCRTIRHETGCFKKRCKDTRRNFRKETKQVQEINPASQRRDCDEATDEEAMMKLLKEIISERTMF